MCLHKKLKEKDEEAYQLLIEKYESMFFCMAKKSIHNEEDCLDCVQEIFLKIYNNIDHCPKDDNEVAPWLITIAKNHIIDFSRKNGKKNDFCINNDDFINRLPAPTSTYKDDGFLEDLKIFLGDEDYEILSMHIVLDLTFVEIGKIINLPTHTARRRVQTIFNKAKGYAERSREEKI